MSELQIGLVIVGVIVVAAVYAFNRLQEGKYRKRAERAFSQRHADVLLEPGGEAGARLEPQFGAETAEAVNSPNVTPAPEIETATETRTSDEVGRIESARLRPSAPVQPVAKPTSAKPGYVDEGPAVQESAIDYVAEIEALVPIPPAKFAELRGRLNEIGKTVHCAGYNPRTAAWENARREADYPRLLCTIQLADRQGAISEAQLRAFRDAITEFASANRANFECPPVQPALTAARKLDQFCIDADIAIGINVVAENKPFSATKVRALAEAAGMRLEHDGAFHYFNEHGAALFTLTNRDPAPFFPEQVKNISTRGVTLLLEVPRVADGVRVLNQMVGLGRSFAAALGGVLVDDNRRALGDAEFAKIRDQVSATHAAMDAQRIAAGSADALRLFA